MEENGDSEQDDRWVYDYKEDFEWPESEDGAYIVADPRGDTPLFVASTQFEEFAQIISALPILTGSVAAVGTVLQEKKMEEGENLSKEEVKQLIQQLARFWVLLPEETVRKLFGDEWVEPDG